MRAGGGTGLNTHRGAGKSSRTGGTGLATLALFGTDAGVNGGDGGSAASGVTASTPGAVGVTLTGAPRAPAAPDGPGGPDSPWKREDGEVGALVASPRGAPWGRLGAAVGLAGLSPSRRWGQRGRGGRWDRSDPTGERKMRTWPPPAPSAGRSHRVPVPLTRAPSFPGAPSGPFSPTSPCGARRGCHEPSPDTLGDTPGVTPGTCHLPGHPWGRRCQLLLSLRAFPAALGVPGRRWGRPGRLHPTAEQNWGHRGAHGSVGGHRAPSQRVPSSPTLGPSVPGVPGSPRGPCSPCAPGEPRSPGKPRSPWRGGGDSVRKRPRWGSWGPW